MDKPKGILIFGIIEIIFTIVMIISSIFGLLLGMAYWVNSFIAIIGLIFYVLIDVIIISSFIGAIGLLKSKEWGRKTLIITAIAFIIVKVVHLFISLILIISITGSIIASFYALLNIIPLIIYKGILIWYLSKKDIKEYFQRTNSKI